jgi:hypothetical protein
VAFGENISNSFITGWETGDFSQFSQSMGELGAGNVLVIVGLKETKIPVGEMPKTGEGVVVLGKYPTYIDKAAELGAKRFSIPIEIWNKMTPTEQWAANVKFLDRAIARSDAIILAEPIKDIKNVTGALRQELDYLIAKGYKLNADGTQMIRK